MLELLRIVLIYPWSLLGRRHEVALEVLALRHQITVLKRRTPRPKLRWWDRCLWVMLKRAWPGWKTPLIIFRPETVIGWQRAGFRMFWRWKSRRRRGRPAKDWELIQLIRRMWSVNPTWGSPRIRDELAKLGFAGFDGHHSKVSPQIQRPTVTELADLSSEPCGWHCSDGFLCGSDGDRSSAL